MTFKYQERVKELQKDIEDVSNCRDKIKKEASLKEHTLYQELYKRKEEVSKLKYENDHLRKDVKNVEEQIKLKKIEI